MANSIANSLNIAITTFIPAAADSKTIICLVIGIVLAVICVLALIGGIKRIGRVTELLILSMSLFYILCTLIIIGCHAGNLGLALKNIFVVCTLTGLTIGVTTPEINFGQNVSSELITGAFATVFGSKVASLFIAIILFLFAFSTILGWALYGTRCVECLFGLKASKVYQIIFSGMIIVGTTTSLEVVWNLADTFNGLMAIPNFIALFALSGVVAKLAREHFARKDHALR